MNIIQAIMRGQGLDREEAEGTLEEAFLNMLASEEAGDSPGKQMCVIEESMVDAGLDMDYAEQFIIAYQAWRMK